jgi:hypothetical protein
MRRSPRRSRSAGRKCARTIDGLGPNSHAPHDARAELASPIDQHRRDFTVYSGDWVIGRIYEQRGSPESVRWFWSLYGVFGKPADMRTDGHAPTLDEAKAQFETAYDPG